MKQKQFHEICCFDLGHDSDLECSLPKFTLLQSRRFRPFSDSLSLRIYARSVGLVPNWFARLSNPKR